MGKFLIPLTQIKPSLSSHVNFFYQTENSFIMDNHRLALWSIVQILKEEKCHLLHVDAHYDCAYGDVEDYKNLNLNLFNMSFEEFLNQKTEDKVFPLFRWDNYLKFLLDYHSDHLLSSTFITHKVGAPYPGILEGDAHSIFTTLDKVKFTSTSPWIVNLDVDFFLTQGEPKRMLFSTDVWNDFFQLIKMKMDRAEVKGLILALSPECSGGFENSYRVAKMIATALNIPFELKL